MGISVIIPAYNEDKILLLTINKIKTYMQENNLDYEIIIVDDGSKMPIKIPNIKILRNNSNRGKGFSVKRGIMGAKKEWSLISDADGSIPITELDKFFPVMKYYPLIISSRNLKNSKSNNPQLIRWVLGKTLSFLLRLLIVPGITDTQCGFKLFKTRIAKELFSNLKTERFAFDIEILLKAKKKNYKLKEIPIICNNRKESKVSSLKDPFIMLKDIIKIKFNL